MKFLINQLRKKNIKNDGNMFLFFGLNMEIHVSDFGFALVDSFLVERKCALCTATRP
jgi:hypothetical protein